MISKLNCIIHLKMYQLLKNIFQRKDAFWDIQVNNTDFESEIYFTKSRQLNNCWTIDV